MFFNVLKRVEQVALEKDIQAFYDRNVKKPHLMTQVPREQRMWFKSVMGQDRIAIPIYEMPTDYLDSAIKNCISSYLKYEFKSTTKDEFVPKEYPLAIRHEFFWLMEEKARREERTLFELESFYKSFQHFYKRKLLYESKRANFRKNSKNKEGRYLST